LRGKAEYGFGRLATNLERIRIREAPVGKVLRHSKTASLGNKWSPSAALSEAGALVSYFARIEKPAWYCCVPESRVLRCVS